jgi:hypothetical protein
MYNKAGVVRSVETVINYPEEFRVGRKVAKSARHFTELVMEGHHFIRGFTNQDIRATLAKTSMAATRLEAAGQRTGSTRTGRLAFAL